MEKTDLATFPFIAIVPEEYCMLNIVRTIFVDEPVIVRIFERAMSSLKTGRIKEDEVIRRMRPYFHPYPILHFAMDLLLFSDENIPLIRVLKVEMQAFLVAWPHLKSTSNKRFLWNFLNTMTENYALCRDSYGRVIADRIGHPHITRMIIHKKSIEIPREVISDPCIPPVVDVNYVIGYFNKLKNYFKHQPQTFNLFLHITRSYRKDRPRREFYTCLPMYQAATGQQLYELFNRHLPVLLDLNNYLSHWQYVMLIANICKNN